ncbi:hypothetical protein M407DRAFT_218263 [Tulasnella calospora MUT 4182]|uniref:F-box domain-containing protein n=1 Tax=Tulasnella calospora MUT 4182 TaxID=1051891 RepID=A0A0C3QB22_9AGAM|nr:hypothetical protein M407DRAFT_218263 [Tulasnella calospora MUT 4182]
MHRALETPVILLLIFEELDSASSLMACAKVCRGWHAEAMFLRVKSYPVSLFNLIQTMAPILLNTTDGEGGFFASLDVPTDRRAITSLDSSLLTGVGANVQSISFDLALDPCSVMMIRGATRSHIGPILPRLKGLVIRPEIERWDLTSIFTALDFLFSISSPVTTVTFADDCDASYVKGMVESFAMNQLPISRLCRGRLSDEDEWPDDIGYDFLWDVAQVELLQPPSAEEWCQLGDCASLQELIVREPAASTGCYYGPVVNFQRLQTLQVPWTMLALLEHTVIPNLRHITLTSFGDASHEGLVLRKGSFISTLTNHSPQLQEIHLHDIFVGALDILQPILGLKHIKVIKLLDVDWGNAQDEDLETIALSLPLLQTFVLRDKR